MASHWKWHRGSQQYSLIWKYKQKSALRFSSEITSATRFSDHLLCHKNKTESSTSSMSVAWFMRMKCTSSKWSLNYGTWPLANFSFIGQIAINIVLRYVFILNDVMFMCLCVGLCTWVQVVTMWRPEENTGSPGAGVAHSPEQANLITGKGTQVICTGPFLILNLMDCSIARLSFPF